MRTKKHQLWHHITHTKK